jgi:polysaccharide pyruvyl transferase WcaK-like protein
MKSKSERVVRVCLIFHSTKSDNLGVGALTASEVEILRDISAKLSIPIQITIMDWKDSRRSYVEGPDIEVRDLDGKVMLNPFGYFAIARRADLVLDIGGGDSFSDIYGGRRLRRMFLLKLITHLAGTPLIMAPQTIGPFKGPWTRRIAHMFMQRALLVTTRDRRSTEAAEAMGVTREIVEASDVALRLPYHAVAPTVEAARARVGINVSGLLMAGGYTGRNELGISVDYPALMRRVLARFLETGAEVHLISHVIVNKGRMAAEDDYRASKVLAEEFPEAILAPPFESPSIAKTYIATMDFFIGARMHACIAALSSGVAVAPMAYSRKFSGLFGSLGYDYTIDCTSASDEEVEREVFTAFGNRQRLCVEASAATKIGLDRLGRYESRLAFFIKKIADTGCSAPKIGGPGRG